jgi:hypothetical protein
VARSRRKDVAHGGERTASNWNGVARRLTIVLRIRRREAVVRTHFVDALFVFGAYLVVSLLLFGLPVVSHMGSSYIGTGGADVKFYTWCLAWWPRSIFYAEHPILTHAIWAPTGYNLAWTTSVPGPSLILAPLTLTLGPIVSFNALSLLSPPLAGVACYLVCRQLTDDLWSSALGGAVFGFSTYEIAQLHGHVNLYLVFAIPVCVYLTLRHLSGELSGRAFVLLLAVALVVQFSISTEVLATMTLVGGISLVLALTMLDRDVRRNLLRAIPLIGLAYVLAAAVVSPYLFYVFAHGIRSRGGAGRGSDLLNLVIPSRNSLLGGDLFPNLVARFPGNESERGSYLGLPLIGIGAHFFVTEWRQRGTKLILAFAIACLALTLGGSLTVAGRSFGWLPWRVLRELPLLRSAQALRFSVYLSLVSAVVVALWLRSRSGRQLWVRSTIALMAVAFLLPNLPAGFWHSSYRMPRFFGTGLHRQYLTRGDTVLILASGSEAMLWQARAGLYFRIPEGYVGAFPPKGFVGRAELRHLLSGRVGEADLQATAEFLTSHQIVAVVLAREDVLPGDPRVTLLSMLWGEPLEIGGILLFRSPQQPALVAFDRAPLVGLPGAYSST